MRIIMITILALACGCGVNTVRVCSADNNPGTCSTGWYDHNGDIVATAHLYGDDELIDATAGYGYIEKGIGRSGYIAPDVVTYRTSRKYKPSRCYADADIGDTVTVSTMSILRSTIIDKSQSTYLISDNSLLTPIDSGSPVSICGCVIGVVTARTPLGIRVTAIRH